MAYGEPGETDGDASTNGDEPVVGGADAPVGWPDAGADDADGEAEGSIAVVPHPVAMMAAAIATAPSREARQLARVSQCIAATVPGMNYGTTAAGVESASRILDRSRAGGALCRAASPAHCDALTEVPH